MSTQESTQNIESTMAGAKAQYQVKITMSSATVSALMSGRYHLYGFKAVQGSQGGGAPLVWLDAKYANNTIVSWTEAYLAYSSISEIVPDAQITPFFAADIELGQLLTVGSDGGGRVGGGGTPGAISILNQGSTPYTCGICVPSNGNMAPICAFPLYGNQMDTVTPLNRILLMFSSRQLPPGTVVGLSTAESLQAELRAAFTPMILIDLEGASEREVSFDINTGWDWGGAPWAQQEPANANLASLLIEW